MPEGLKYILPILFLFSSNHKGALFPHNGFEADFTETVLNPGLQMEKTYKGRIYYQKPYSLRLNIFEPDTQFIITNGESGWWILPEEKELREFGVEKLKDVLPFHFLSGENDSLWRIDKKEGDTVKLITFIPLKENPLQDTLVLGLKSGLPSLLLVKRVTGEILEFHFSNAIPRDSLPDTLFQRGKER